MSNNTHGQDGSHDDEDGPEDRESSDEHTDRSASNDRESSSAAKESVREAPAAESSDLGASLESATDAGGVADTFVEGAVTGEDATTATVSTDRLFELLASPGNRFVLTYLLRVDGPAAYADLVEYVIANADPPAEMTEAKFRGRVAATLINERLPELSDAGFVEVDTAAQLVSPTPAVATAAPHLALALSDIVNPPPSE